jgi:hypothetical protein
MKKQKVEYIVKSNQEDKIIVTTEVKAVALEALHNYGGHILKRVTTVEELKPIDKDFTVWI